MAANARKLSVFGLGKLGSPMLAVFSDSGHLVVGCDIATSLVESIRNGVAPVDEPGLQELLDRNRSRISATSDVMYAVRETEASFIIVPTPSGVDCCFINDYVVSAVMNIGRALREKEEYHLVVVTSTVMPGSTDGVIKAALQEAAGREVGENLGLCYSPEFIALGTVIRDMQNPDLLLIGQSDAKAGDLLEDIMKSVVKTSPECHRMNFVCAELAKISVNTFVTTKISYANMLAELCDALPGGDVDVVTSAIGCDTRIGRKYLKGATAYGGPCFPRDNKAFSALGHSLNASVHLAEATDEINNLQVGRFVRLVKTNAKPGSKIAILGLSYKPDTSVSTMSQSYGLTTELQQAGFQVVLSDPACAPCNELHSLLSEGVVFDHDFNVVIKDVDTVVVMTAWNQYKQLAEILCQQNKQHVTVIDPWRIVDNPKLLDKVVVPGKHAMLV